MGGRVRLASETELGTPQSESPNSRESWEWPSNSRGALGESPSPLTKGLSARDAHCDFLRSYCPEVISMLSGGTPESAAKMAALPEEMGSENQGKCFVRRRSSKPLE